MPTYHPRRTFGKQKHDLPISHPHVHPSKGPRWMPAMTRRQAALLVLVIQNSVLVLMLRYSRVAKDGNAKNMYTASTAVFMAEVIKIMACMGMLRLSHRSWQSCKAEVRRELMGKPRETAKMLVPSAMYALQNNLLYIALSNLDAATFQVTYQLKVLSTAVFSVLLLGRELNREKWMALALLMAGVTLVQWQDGDEAGRAPAAHSSQSATLGLMAVMASCVSSGFAGCYFEKILKSSETSMWIRNIQLGICGTLFSFVAMVLYDLPQLIEQGGLFYGYTWLTWTVVVNQALGGLLVAVVVKYADNILKSFATSLSIILSSFISCYLFGFQPSLPFILGTTIVITATYLYGRNQTLSQPTKPL